jgi:hypothetical protein
MASEGAHSGNLVTWFSASSTFTALCLLKHVTDITEQNKLGSYNSGYSTAYLHYVFCLLIDMTDIRKRFCLLTPYQLVNMLEDTWGIHWYEAS